MDLNIGIYCWTSPEGKRYIGQSKNLKYRYKQFFNKFNYQSNDLIKTARLKYYNFDEWKYEVLEYCSKEELNKKEEYWILYYKSNNPEFGYNLVLGYKTALNTKHTAEQIEKIKRTLLKRSRAVLQYDLQGNFIAEYPSLREAGRQNNIPSNNIPAVCKGRKKSLGGFIWRYKYPDNK